MNSQNSCLSIPTVAYLHNQPIDMHFSTYQEMKVTHIRTSKDTSSIALQIKVKLGSGGNLANDPISLLTVPHPVEATLALHQNQIPLEAKKANKQWPRK